MKKGVKVLAVSFLVCLMAVASAMAFNLTDRVTIAPNGKGDLLYYPAYFTGDGWESEITLINTSDTDSVVAHIAIRRALDSEERDFLVFLSPTDVFDFKITQNANGEPVLITDDASLVIRNDCYSAADYAADNGQPYEFVLGAGWETGYVEVVAVAQKNLGVPPVDKTAICNDYREYAMSMLAPWPADPLGRTWNDADNILTGTIEIYNAQTHVRGALRAFALKDYDNLYAPKFGETLDIGSNARNTKVEVDAVLCNDNVVVPYVGLPDGQTLYTATFPTKSGAYLVQLPNGEIVSRTATYRLFDTEEHEGAFSPTPKVPFWEMTTIVFPQDTTWGEPIVRGWVLVDYDGSIAGGLAASNTAVTVYDGVPTINTCMHTIFGDNGDINGLGWFYCASDMGAIDYAGTVASHYAPTTLPAGLCPLPAVPTPGTFCNY
jgi:hypothetical protein